MCFSTYRLPDSIKWTFVYSLLFVFTNSLSAGNNPPNAMTLTCPSTVIVNPQPGECGTTVDFNMLQWNSTLELADTIFNPGPQNYFTYGATQVTLTVTSTTGVQESCVFNVFVQQFSTPLNCQDGVLVYIVDACEMELTADRILSGGPYGCNDAYTVTIFDNQGQPIGNTVTPALVGNQNVVSVMDNQTMETCFGSIIAQPDSLPQSITCPPDITIRCHEPIDPTWTDRPEYENCFEEELVEVEYEDFQINSFCDGDDIAFEISRTWTVTNPFQVSLSCEQIITGRRIFLNEIIFPPDYDGTDLPPLACTDTLEVPELADTSLTGIPLANGFDPHFLACNVSVNYTDSIVNVCGSSYEITRTWIALDYCKNDSIVHDQFIDIVDLEAPQFTVPDTIYASSQGVCSTVANLPPIDLIEECSFYEVFIQTPWGNVFSNGGDIQIPLDDGEFPITYTVSDACGNASVTSTLLKVQNNVIAACPPNASINGNYFLQTIQPALDTGNLSVLAEFGYPEFSANCGSLTFSENLTIDVDSCGEGTLSRFFDVVETSESCLQSISVEQVSDFVVEFPADITIQCSTAPAQYGEPIISNGESEAIEVTFSDEVFVNEPDACFRILRTWTVKNNCVTGVADDNEAFESSEANLGLPFPECDLDGDGDCDSLTFRDSWSSAQMPDASIAGQMTIPDSDPDSDPWDGYISYVQEIVVIDDVDPVFTDCALPDVCIIGNGCAGEVTLPVPDIDDCTDVTVNAQVSFGGATMNGLGPFQGVSPGTYEVLYFAIDLCENESTCETTVTVVDCTPPTPVCQPQTTLTIETGTTPPSVGVFAADLNGGSFDNCPGGLQFSFSSSTVDLGRVFFCDDLGLQSLQLYVTDLAGNQDSCEVSLIIQEPSPGFCGGTPTMTVSGNVYTELSSGIEGAEVASSQGLSSLTDVNGHYTIGYNNNGNNFTLTPFLDSNPLNGVTTFDALLVIKHVLGQQILDSPYKIIAADVNGSNSVTTFDALRIRQLILNLISEFSAGSWRFVPEDFSFPNPLNPFDNPFPESATLPIPAPAFGPDFIGMKIGDLNNSASPNFQFPIDARNGNKSIELRLSNFYAEANQVIEVPVFLSSNNLIGCQFAIDFKADHFKLLKITPGQIDDHSFGQNEIGSGILKVSWLADQGGKYHAEKPAFTLHFLVKKPGHLSDLIKLSAQILKSEAYSESLEKLDLILKYQKPKAEIGGLVLHPPRPNPFNQNTVISFDTTHSDEVGLFIYNASGRLVKTYQAKVSSGTNQFIVEGDELPEKGLYFYQIRSSSGTDEGKMFKH